MVRTRIGTPRKVFIGGVVRREPVRHRVVAQAVEAQRARGADQLAEQTLAARVGADGRDARRVDADRDELAEALPVDRDDAQGAVLRVDERDGGLDDALQDRLELKPAADDEHGVEQLLQSRSLVHLLAHPPPSL